MGGAPRLPSLLFLSLTLPQLIFADELTIKEVSLGEQILQFLPPPGESCGRVQVLGTSRLNLNSYLSHLRVTLKFPETLPRRIHGKIEVCVHRNSSLGMCLCKEDEWQFFQKGNWTTVMSPYANSYIDIKYGVARPVPIMIIAREEFQKWRMVCLVVGFLLLLSAPVVSSWVPFYYSTFMALGVLLVVLLILFHGMKLLPMGRKNILYLTFYGTALGIGSFITHYFSAFVNSILLSFGLSEEMHNPVTIFLLLGIFVGGAALGFWMVRKFVLSDDGSVNLGTSLFVKWAMRVFSMFFILQSTIDPLSAVASLVICWCICSIIYSSVKWMNLNASRKQSHPVNVQWQKRARRASASYRKAEFLGRSAEKPAWKGASQRPASPYSISSTPGKGKMVYKSPPVTSTPPHRLPQQDYYSSFHRNLRRRFTKKGWDDFTEESTKRALAEWASSPEVIKWVVDNAHRMRLTPDNNSDERTESSSGSSEETAVETSGDGLELFKWY